MQPILLLQSALDDLRAGRSTPAGFCRATRAQRNLLAALPLRYTEVLDQLLDRLKANALFSEESGSFSQGDLLDNLQVWIDKARTQVLKACSAP